MKLKRYAPTRVRPGVSPELTTSRNLEGLESVMAQYAEAIEATADDLAKVKKKQDTTIPAAILGRGQVWDIRAFPSLASALAAFGSDTVTLYITKEVAVSTNTTIPSNISVVVLKGGSFSISNGVTLTINGAFEAGMSQVFTGSGTAVLAGIPQAYAIWFGALPGEDLDCAIPINKALGANKNVKLVRGYHQLESTIELNDGNRLYGQGKNLSYLKVEAGVEITNFILADGVDDIEIFDLGFDNYDNYPDPNAVRSTEEKYLGNTFPEARNTAFRATNGGSRFKIHDCYFYGLTGMSIRFQQGASPFSDIWVLNNLFEYGSYILNVINISGVNGGPTTKNVVVAGNVSNYNSSQKYILVGIALSNISNDAIHLDYCEQFLVSNNVVNYSGAIAIRIEQCTNGNVSGNTTLESGSEGISVYNSGFDISVTGNNVKRWGRVPDFGYVRSYGGQLYMAREAAESGVVNLPANPSISSWFAVVPYSLDGLDVSKVPDYDDGNYYDGGIPFTSLGDGGDIDNQANFETPSDFGILPFRGFAGISVDQISGRVIVAGNRIEGTLALGGDGKYTHASDFGISTVHPFNMPQDYPSPMIAYNNIITGCIQDKIYQPDYCDPINSRGAISGVRTYPSNFTENGSSQLEELPYTVHPDQVFEQTVTIQDDLTVDADQFYSAEPFRILADTSDGSDTKSIGISGGGTANHARGAYVHLYGNEHATNPGKLKIVAGAISGGGDIEFWTNNALRVTIARVSGTVTVAGPVTLSDILEVAGVSVFSAHLRRNATTGITASTTQTQGQQALTSDVNIVSTCANANDVVTLPSAAAGMTIYIRNNGAQTLQIFPASGDTINGAAADTSTTLAVGASVTYRTADNTNWYS